MFKCLKQCLFKKCQLPFFSFSLGPDQSCCPGSHLSEWGRVHLLFSRGCSVSLSSASISAACLQWPSLHVYGICKKAILTVLLSLTRPPFLKNASYCFVSSLYSSYPSASAYLTWSRCLLSPEGVFSSDSHCLDSEMLWSWHLSQT